MKNLRRLGGVTLLELAVRCALRADVDDVAVSTDIPWTRDLWEPTWAEGAELYQHRDARWLQRPAALAQDDTPMLAVVQHALGQIPGQPDDIIVLLQPTQPLRKPEHITEAIRLLGEIVDQSVYYEGHLPDSVVSIVPVPITHAPDYLTYPAKNGILSGNWFERPTRRQDVRQPYRPDGTVYAFRRSTVSETDSIYGFTVRGLVIDPADSCELDTEADWTALQARWEARGTAARS